jgi:hypothetical protein
MVGDIFGVSIIGILNVEAPRLMYMLIDVGERARAHYCGGLKGLGRVPWRTTVARENC